MSIMQVETAAAASKLSYNTYYIRFYPRFIQLTGDREQSIQHSHRERLFGDSSTERNLLNNRGHRLPLLHKFVTMADSENLESGKFYMLGRDLANTEKSVRDKAVDTIRRYFFI